MVEVTLYSSGPEGVSGESEMNPEPGRSRTGRLRIWLVVAAALLAGNALAADQPQPDAAAILRGMADYLAGLKTFSCTYRNGYEVLQPSGQMIEFGETRRVSLARPDRLRIEEVSSDGTRDLALFDGKLMTVYNADAGVYAQVPQPGSIDDALVYFVRDLHMRMPLAQLLSSHLGNELPALVKDLKYVESTDLLGVATHHIVGRTDSVDFQFWIAEGSRPLPLRVVIKYTKETGKPVFWSEFSKWNTNAKLAGSTFQLTLPKDAQQIAFAVQVSRPGGEVRP
jgi:hypothetical protein